MSLLTLLSTAAAGIAYTLTSDVGAFALSGQDASLKLAQRLSADAGSFDSTGQAASLRVGKSVIGGVGTFSVAGEIATFRVRRASTAATFTLTGHDATLTASKQLVSSVGSFTLAGQLATLRVDKKLSLSVGAFVLAGEDATLRAGKSVTGEVGTFILTGQSSVLSVGKRLILADGSFALTGQPASLTVGTDRVIQSDVGAFALTGNSAILLKTKLLVGSAGSFALTGGDVAFLYRRSQVGRNQIGLFPSPVNSVGVIDSNTVRSNDNITVEALNAHDSDASIHMQSGLLISRPAITAEGATYFCTDTRDTYTYVSNAWVQSGWAHWYGSFSDYTDQTIAAINTATRITFDTVDMVSGFSLVSGSRMTAAYAGNYNFQWSGQFTNSDSAEQDVEIWVRINGVDVVGSAGRISVPKRHGTTDGHVLPGWNYFLTLAVGDYIELYWAAASTAIKIEHGNASAWAPSTASIIATMDRI